MVCGYERRPCGGACSKCWIPTQNSTFRDHYLDIPLRPEPGDVRRHGKHVWRTVSRSRCYDRMEIIELSSYTPRGKVCKSRKPPPAGPSSSKENGLTKCLPAAWTDGALRARSSSEYTSRGRRARRWSATIGAVCRKGAIAWKMDEETKSLSVSTKRRYMSCWACPSSGHATTRSKINPVVGCGRQALPGRRSAAKF